MARKSYAEARIERLTWALLVLIFAVIYLLSDSMLASLPNWMIPLSGAVILIGSGLFQYSRRWRVSPITWIAGVIMLFFAFIGFYLLPQRQFIVETLIVTLIVIVVGTFTGET